MFAKVRTLIMNNGFAYKHSLSSFPEITQRIFSGIQPTGIPHIGNYFGAIKHWVELQRQYDSVIFSIVDLHSITTVHDPDLLRNNTLDMTAALLGCGLDPEKSILFQQSHIPQHSELAWILGCLATMPRLQHLHQWKEKSEKLKEVPLGIFSYPVLQAADILLYRSTHVPVGEDQLQHIELTRHLAKRFNNTYKVNYFPQPKAIITDLKRIKSLRSVSSKMSKSEEDPKSRIELLDSPDDIMNKIKKSVTDSNPSITYDPENRLGISNLVDIHSALTGQSPHQIVQSSSHMNTVDYKKHLAEVIIESINPLRDEILRLKGDSSYLNSVLQKGAFKAREIAESNHKTVKRLIGLS